MTNVAQQDKPVVNTMHTTVYSHDGYKLNIVLAIDTVADIGSYLDEIRAAGLTPNIPGLEPGQEKEAIAAVVRRASTKGTPVIDFYAHWQYEGKFGAHKYAHMYLDTPEQVAEFEAHSGLRLADLPLYEGQQAVKREFGKPTRFETEVRRPFEIVRTPDGQHDTGMAKYIYSYAVPMPTAPQQQTPPKQAATSRKSNAPVQRGTTIAETQEDAPESENLRDVVLTAVTVEKNETTGNRRMRFVTTDNLQSVFSWTRQPFITGGWCDERDWMEPNIYTLPAPAPAKVKWNATENGGYWTVESVDPFQPDFFNQPVMNASAVTHDTTPEHIDDPLKGEMLDFTRVEPRMHRGRSQRYQWVGHARFDGQPITVLIFKEDEAAIREAGYDTSGWDSPDGRVYRDGGIAMTTLRTATGRQVAAVWHISEQKLVETERVR